MQELLSGNLIIPVRSNRKSKLIKSKSGSIDDSTVASASPKDFSAFRESYNNLHITSFPKIESKKIRKTPIVPKKRMMRTFKKDKNLDIISLFPHESNLKNFRMMKSKHRVILCKAAEDKKNIQRKIKEKIKRKKKLEMEKEKNKKDIETLATYKLFRISVLQNNRHFRNSHRRIVLPILSQFQRKKIFKKNESAQKIMDIIKTNLNIKDETA